jgi:hypothetical protein
MPHLFTLHDDLWRDEKYTQDFEVLDAQIDVLVDYNDGRYTGIGSTVIMEAVRESFGDFESVKYVPIILGGWNRGTLGDRNHWALLAIENATVLIMNSLATASYQRELELVAQRVVKVCKLFHPSCSFSHVSVCTPQQLDSSSCGLGVVGSAYAHKKGSQNWFDKEGKSTRGKMAVWAALPTNSNLSGAEM